MKQNVGSRANFGLDAPYVVVGLLVGGFLYLLLYIFLFFFSLEWLTQQLPFFMRIFFEQQWLLLFSASCFIPAFLMILSSRFGKYMQAEKLLTMIQWHGNERVLDIGCGRGLLLIKAAQLLTTGKVIGIDLWQAKDLSHNSRHATLKNAALEGVADKVEVLDANACSLPFENNSFDVVVSSLVIHNIPTQALREIALHEMVRVVKPNGIIMVQDFRYTKEYYDYFKALSVHSVKISPIQWLIFPPVWIVIIKK